MFALKPHCPSDLFLPWEVMPTQWSDDIMLHALAVLRFTTSTLHRLVRWLNPALDGSRAAWVLEKKCERNRGER
jgi:hypothetical protein